MLRKELLDSTRGRVVALLRRGPMSVDELASELGVTPNAVRSQLTSMERDGLVGRAGQRPGVTRPASLYTITPEVEQLLSRAYIPLLAHLVRVFAEGLPSAQVDALLRKAGRSLAEEVVGTHSLSGNLASRVELASRLMNEQLGAITHVEGNGSYVIRGTGCPLAALTGKHRAVCLAMESLLAELVDAPVHECCERSARPRCCFEIAPPSRARRA